MKKLYSTPIKQINFTFAGFSSSSNDIDPHQTSRWPKYLVMEHTDPQQILADKSIFLIRKVIQGLTGQSTKTDKQGPGFLLIEVNQRLYAETLLRTTVLNSDSLNIPVRVSPHRTLNTSRGTVYIPKYTGEREEDILAELYSGGVSEVKRIDIRGKPSPLLKLKFDQPTLPSHTIIGYERFEVGPDYPHPFAGGCLEK